MLEVSILDIEMRQDWGWNIFRGLVWHHPRGLSRTTGSSIFRSIAKPIPRRCHGGLKIPTRPFFGQLAVAPRPEYGRQNSKEPREFGGNMDCKELVAGSKVYLPVWTKGALFSTGDGHAAQGDGEVCGTAIETALTGNLRVQRSQGSELADAACGTPTHFIALGLDVDSTTLRASAARDDRLAGRELTYPRDHAYSFCSFVCRSARHPDRQQRQRRARDDRKETDRQGVRIAWKLQ